MECCTAILEGEGWKLDILLAEPIFEQNFLVALNETYTMPTSSLYTQESRQSYITQCIRCAEGSRWHTESFRR